MISSKTFLNVDGATKRFLSDFIIKSEQHVNVFVHTTPLAGETDLVAKDYYDLVDNSISFYTAPIVNSNVTLQVATTPEELNTSPSVLDIVAANIDDINTLALIDEQISTIAPHVANVDIVANNINDVNTVANDIHNVNILGQAIESGGVSGTGGGGQFVGNSVIKGIQYMAQTTNEDLVIPEGTNAFSLGSLILEDGASIEVPDGSIYKVL